MASRLGQHAVIIGGSVAGLTAARVLSDHFARVTVLERDPVAERPEVRKSVPQGHHVHTLLLGGERALSALYPGFTDRLRSMGAVSWRTGLDNAVFRPDGKVRTLALGSVREARDLGFDAYNQSRGVLEHCIRRATLEIANVELRADTSVQSVVFENGRVCGVRCGDASVAAELVVDASGRGSRAPRWLAELGYKPPQETAIGVDLGYASTRFRVPDSYAEPERYLAFFGPAPRYTSGAYLAAIEDGQWILTLVGRFGAYPPTDEAGFLAFAASLHTPLLHNLVKDAERVAEIAPFRYAQSVHRHYERLETFPAGFLVIGDAVCSFNPVYGQGMSTAAQQARALQQVLAGATGLDGLAQAFFPKAAEVIAAPWAFTASADLAFPQTRGDRSVLSKERARYFSALGELMNDDIEVHRLVAEVLQLAKPLSFLMEEPLRSRVAERQRQVVPA